LLFLSKAWAETLINVGDVSPQVNDLDTLQLIHGEVFTLKDVFVGLFLLDAQEVTLTWPKDKEVWLLPPKVFVPFVK